MEDSSSVDKHISRKLLGSIFVGLLLTNVFWLAITIEPVLASPGLTLKWSEYLGTRGRTSIGPLAADLLGDDKLEIVVTGGDTGGVVGAVTALNGSTGTVLWQADNKRIHPHSPFDIVDLNKDGIPEIVVSAWYTMVFHGNNGSTYWINKYGRAYQNYNAIYDIDGDGYPEVFVSCGIGPWNGYDYITRLSHDGNILDQAWTWHSCWGGMTIGDTNFDGRFELYQGDRSIFYNPSEDPYKGGGMGVRALDAHTLEPLWNDPTVLCSSQAPILADVDKDGILDVIVAMQTNNGIAVLNSADGSVVTTGGIYRKGRIEVHGAHSQTTVYDLDGDGNLELIECRDSVVKIWDLYDWKLDATLPLVCEEPPKVGDVTGDGEMDIIAVNSSDIYVYSYDITGDYIEVDHVGGLSEANAFTLVQDVDGDDLNELVVTSENGWVYCYDTTAPAPTPRARSGLQFYSEYKCGAAEYVSPPTPIRPALTDEQPPDGSQNQMLNPTLSIYANSFQGNSMDITFRTNASGTWEDVGTPYTGVGNGVYTANPTNMDSYGTTYYWSVNATDTASGNWTYKTYSFTTYSNPPTHGEPILVSSGGTNGTKENLTCYNQTTFDPDGDEVTNIYNWIVNDDSLTNLLLPFDTRPDTNIHALLTDGFEDSFDNWDGNGLTDWDRSTGPNHSGSYSAHAGSGDTYLTSDDLDASTAQSITVSFWYRDDDIDDNDDVYLQFWNGSAYRNIFELGNTSPEDEWHHYSIWYRTLFHYGIPDFHIRFEATGIDADENLRIDDVSITVEGAPAKDYSGYDNHGAVGDATWTGEGVVGGAYTFDGDDYIRVRENAASLGGDGTWSEISVEFWVKATTNTGTERLIWKHNASDTGDVGYRVDFRAYSTSNYVRWRVYTPSVYELTHTISGGARDWHHVVCTYNSGPGLKIYVDGTVVASSFAIGNIQATGDGPLEIGYRSGSGDFRGMLDEVRIYPKALSPFQVSERYLETKDGLSNNSTIAWQETEVGDEWKCQVTPNDGFGDGEPEFSNTTLIHESDNTPPVAGNLIIAPLSPTTVDDLIASYDFFDADGDPEYGTEILWYRDGILQPDLNYSSTVASSFTAKDQFWYFTMRPKDGAEFGDLQPSPLGVTILNAPPSFTDVVITPDPAFDTSTLTANPYGWFDDDNDPEGYVYQWQKLEGGSWQDLFGETSQTLTPDHFDRGDTIRVNCTAYDGEDLGTSHLGTRWIVDSDPPTHGDPLLVSSHGTNRTDEELICYNQNTTDPDGDEVTNIYHWIRNDVSITNLLMPFEINSSVTARDCSGYDNDGEVSGALWTSDGVVGGAYIFDGDDYIRVRENAASLGGDGTWSEISVEFWVKATTNTGTERLIWKHNASDTGDVGYRVDFRAYSTSNYVRWRVYTPSVYELTHTISGGARDWHHVVCTYNSGPGLKIYVDGTVVASSFAIGNIQATGDGPLEIGYRSGSGDFRGMLDEVKIYPMALTPAQIFQRYIETKDGLSSSSTIVPQETTSGDVWTCEVIPNDSWQDGTAKTSNTLTVLAVSGNSRPRIDMFTPTETTLEVFAGESSVSLFTHVSSDPDGDPLTYSWLVDDVEKATTQNLIYTPGYDTVGIHNVTLIVSDGELIDSQQWIITVRVGTHDVAVTDVTPCKTIVGQNYSLSIIVTIENQGDFTETFNVTAYANTTAIQTLNVTNLPPGNSITITFTWNTTGFAKGSYTISANATTVPDETDTGDNSHTDGTVRVNMVGDIREEFGVVNILDIVYAALGFDAERMPNGTYWHTPPCNATIPCPHDPNADINDDGFINIIDLVIIAIHMTI